MRVKFHLSADMSVFVESEPHGEGVSIIIARGVCFEHKPGEECPEVNHEAVFLKKSEARAIASAMMGCAAEVA